MTIKTIDVVCAFIVARPEDKLSKDDDDDFRILCAQRYNDAEHFPSMYEFPGGKVDLGESHVDALRRECTEELGVEVELLYGTKDEAGATIRPCYTFCHAPKHDARSGGTVVFRLSFYWAQIRRERGSDVLVASQKQPIALASQKIEWLTPTQMAKLVFCPGDEPIIEALHDGSLRPEYPNRIVTGS